METKAFDKELLFEDEQIGKVYKSTDYDSFCKLEGNRAVKSGRVTKILKSIEKYGYIYNPIVVNEKKQVIDGQGRFEALQQLGLPIIYVVADGAGLDQCVALNQSTTQWTTDDFIDSYCEQGNDSYIRLRRLVDEFPQLTMYVKAVIITGLWGTGLETIRNGKATITETLEKVIREDMKFATRFVDIIK